MRHTILRSVCAFTSFACMLIAAPAAHADLEQIRHVGILKVAVYKDMPPFSDKGAGIDVDLANALAAKLGLKTSFLPFDAGEQVNDDLRNMVWKGHYLGYGPADVMMHVPVDNSLMAENGKVTIFAPYYRDRVRLVRDTKRIPACESIDCVAGHRVGVEKISISAMVLLGEQDGRFRNDVKIYDSAAAALEKMKAGEVNAVLASQSEIESVIKGDPRYALSDVSFARLPRQGWIIGLSVKKDNVELARALQAAANELADSGELAKIFAKHGVSFTRP
jgi:ABC-type amino acid transport substrate-binding protein